MQNEVDSVKKLLTLGALYSLSWQSLAESKFEFSGELGVGVEQESTQIIDLIDTVQNTDNAAFTWQINLNLDYEPTEKDKLTFSANHIDKDFREIDIFDSRLFIYSGSYSHEYEHFTAGIRSQLIRSELDGVDFLSMHQVSPYVSFFVGRKWFFNLSFNYADKTLETNPDRSALSREISGDVYHFFKGINHYVLFGYRARDENAESDLFNYQSNQIRVSWLKRFELGGKSHKVRLNWRYQKRDYDDVINPDIDDFRVDNRRQWEVQWESQLNDAWAVHFNYRRNEQDSSLNIASYDQNIHGVRLEYQF